MVSQAKIFGQQKEREARAYLEEQGLKFVAANYSCKIGEIDLIMQDGAALVFVEVRYRDRSEYGGSIASITRSKQRKIIRTALFYLQSTNLLDKIACRFDVVAYVEKEGEHKINWIKDAFWS